MDEWIKSRGTGSTHPLTQELKDAIVSTVKKYQQWNTQQIQIIV